MLSLVDLSLAVNFGCFAPSRCQCFHYNVCYEKSNQGAQELAHNSAKRAHTCMEKILVDQVWAEL